MTLILSNAEVEQVLTMAECIEEFERAYVDLAEGSGVSRSASECRTATGRADAEYGLKTMDGVNPRLGVAAVRINSDILTAPVINGVARRVKVPSAPNQRYVGLVLLFSTTTGEPLAIFPDGIVQRMRVAAASGLAARRMVRADARRAAILGSGFQAETQLSALCAVRPIETVRCFSPDPEHRRDFARRMSASLGIPVSAVDQPEQAVTGADVVLCASNALQNTFFERWLEPGMHVGSIKLSEIEPAAIRRADLVAIHTHDAMPIQVTAAGLTAGQGWGKAKGIEVTDYPTLADLVAGRAPARTGPEQITCFLNNIGLGYQFAVAGALVLRNAKASGLGHELPTDWFTEDVHP